MIDDLQYIRLLDIQNRLRFFIMINEDQILTRSADQIPARYGSDILFLLIKNRIVAVAAVLHDTFNIIDFIRAVEDDQVVPLSHQELNRDGLIDQPCDRIGIMRAGNDGAPVSLGQLQNRRTHGSPETYHHTAHLQIKTAELVVRAVADDNQIILLNILPHHVRMKCADDDTALRKIPAAVADKNLAVQCIGDRRVLRLRFRQDVVIGNLHIGLGDIRHRDQPPKLILFRGDRERDNILVIHLLPGLLHRQVAFCAGHLVDLDFSDLCAGIRQISRQRNAEVLQHKLRLFINLSCPHRQKLSVFLRTVLNVGICDRGTDGIRIRIAVTDRIDWFCVHYMPAPPHIKSATRL